MVTLTCDSRSLRSLQVAVSLSQIQDVGYFRCRDRWELSHPQAFRIHLLALGTPYSMSPSVCHIHLIVSAPDTRSSFPSYRLHLFRHLPGKSRLVA
jgi:hypothetical protein